MSELSRPLQVVLALVLAFAALWFVALRKHASSTSPSPATATHAATSPAPHKSAIPGGLGRAVDKANAAKAQGDAAAAAASRQGATPEDQTATPSAAPAGPAPAPAAKAPSTVPRPNGAATSPAGQVGQIVGQRAARSANAAVQSGLVAVGLAAAAALGGSAHPTTVQAARLAAPHRAPVHRALPGVTPGMIRQALARGDAVALLFYSPLSSDDRAVRAELPLVNRRGGRVAVYGVALNGLARFKNVLRGIQVVQSPTVVVMARGANPRLLEGYTDHAEIDQATLLALTSA
jgi:hypothetical protein